MDAADAAHTRCMIFALTSPVARDAFGSWEDDMWDTEAEVERGVTDASPYGYETVWAQLECEDYEGRAPGWDMDPAEIRAAYDLVKALDEAILDLFDRSEAYGLIDRIKEQARAAAAKEAAVDEEDEATETSEAESLEIKLLDPLRKCRRCKGTGVFHIWSGPVDCRNCSGTGQVPSVRDRRRIQAADRNIYRLIKVMRERAEERDGCRNGRIEFESHQGFGLLEQNERHRLPALFRSLEAGRVDDVIDALIAYRNAHVVKESA